MKIEKYIPTLIRAALDNDVRMIRAVSERYLKYYRKQDPEIAKEISDALSYNSVGQNSLRSIGYGNVPRDNESRMELVQVQEPIEYDQPIFNKEINNEIIKLVNEREKVSQLIEVGLKPTSSILLHGKPGVGKTASAKYLAGRLNMKFASIDMSSAVSSYLGKTGQNLKKILDFAREEPTLMLLDEFDAIAKKRDDQSDLGELKRVVNVLLKELEDWPAHSVIVAATNHPELLDRAIWRRFDQVIEIPLPDAEARYQLFENYLDNRMETSMLTILTKLSKDMSPAEIEQISTKAKKENVLYNSDIIVSTISHITKLNKNKDIEVLKQITHIARDDYKMTFREIADMIGKGKTTVQYYYKK